MDDIEKGRADFLLPFQQFGASLRSEFFIQTGQGFVHEQDLWLQHQGSGNCYALLFTAG